MPLRPTHFIGEPIEAIFDRPPAFTKKPDCPNGFRWQGQTFRVEAVLQQWIDYARKGRMARNMRPERAAVAARRGSWGVGRFYFRVRAEGGRCFELYYDRSPKDAGHRQGEWFLVSELKE